MAGGGSDWGELPDSSFDDKEKLGDKVKLLDKKKYENRFEPYRFFGKVFSEMVVWVPIFKDGKPILNKKNQPVRIPKTVTNYDPSTHKLDEDKECPYLQLAEKMNKYLPEDTKKLQLQIKPRQSFFSNVIDRDLQENKPENIKKPTKEERESGFKDIESKSWTPYAVATLPPSHMRKVRGLVELNTIKDKKTGEKKAVSIAHPKFGRDVNLKYLPDESGTGMYDAQPGERTPLTDEEKEYLIWDIETAIGDPDSPKEAKKEADRLWNEFKKTKYYKNAEKDSDDGDDDEDGPTDLEDDDDAPKKNKKKSKVDDDDDEEEEKSSKKKKKSSDDDDDDEDDEKSSSKKKKKKPVDDDDDDEEEDRKSKNKKKRSRDDDEDEDEEEDKKSSKKKKKPVDDDDDEEEEVKPKKKKKSSDDDDDDEDERSSKKKKKKKPVDDDDDLDLDDDDPF